jgi:hypothetical protein
VDADPSAPPSASGVAALEVAGAACAALPSEATTGTGGAGGAGDVGLDCAGEHVTTPTARTTERARANIVIGSIGSLLTGS